MEFTPYRFIDKDKSKSEFFATLRKRVDAYFKEKNLSKHYNGAMLFKTIILLLAYVIPFVCLLLFRPSFGISLILWATIGLALAGIGMSVMHDANHGAYSSSSKTNYLLGHTLNLLGGSVYNWKLQHNFLHHTYTNIVNMDDDIDDKALFRFSPHNKAKWFHKFQVAYVFFFYSILTLHWALLKDFEQYLLYTKEGVNKNNKAQNRMLFLRITLSKIFYFSIFLVIPLVVLKMPVAPFVMGYIFMQLIAGIVLSVVFQLAHTIEETEHPLPVENYTIENNWAIHQMNTTANFARDNKLLSWYVGGLNFQVEHHLFPTVCHVHYPQIAHIVKATAEEYGIKYLENKTFFSAFKSHLKALMRFGKLPKMNEVLG